MALAGFSVFWGSYFWKEIPYVRAPRIGGLIAFACAVTARIFLGRCGSCRKLLSRPLSCGGWPWTISRAFRFCPYCAASLDEPVTPAPPKEEIQSEDHKCSA
jgi:hypothetical protein